MSQEKEVGMRVTMKASKKNFKGLDYYKLQQDGDGNIKLNDYDDILNARRARVDLLLDNTPDNNIDLTKLNKALSEKFVDNHELLSEFDKEDKEIAQEELKVFSILESLEDLKSVKSKDLLEISLLLSDLSFIERNVVLNTDQNSDLAKFKSLFIEKKSSGEEYSDEECKDFLDDIDKINTIIKLELESRIERMNHDERNDYGDLQDEIGQEMNAADKSKKNN
ncbi:WD_0853 family protein [Wolbachia pipientis]